jgi:dihydrodipicolinate synthase/N-acetylneuraminate lyase
MIYHNPPLHRVTLTVEACEELTGIPSVVAMKETERDTNSFMKLMRVVKNRVSVFVHQREYHPYAELGAAGCWSIDAWMGPWPLLALRDAITRGDRERAEQLVLEITAGVSGPMPPAWRETALKLGVQFAGYCDPGPLRRPYVHVPAAVADGMRARAAYWQELCARYRPAGATSEPGR